MAGDDEYCAACSHQKSMHDLHGNGKCRAEQVRDKDGALTQQFILCRCEKFVPRPIK